MEKSAATFWGHSTEAGSGSTTPAAQVQMQSFQHVGKSTSRPPPHANKGRDVEEHSASGGAGEDHGGLKRKDFWHAAAVFLLMGLNTLLAWNVMLNLAPYMTASYFGGRDLGNTVLACFQGACILVQLAFIRFGCRPKAILFYVAAAVNAGAFLAVTPAAAYCSEMAAIVLIHLLCFVLGAACGVIQGAGFAYAGALPVNFAVFISAGQGIAGLAAFALNTLLGFAFFDLDTYAGLTKQAWTLYVICAALSALLAAGIYSLSHRSWARLPSRAAAECGRKGERPSLVVCVVSGDGGGKLRRVKDESRTQSPTDAWSTDSTRRTEIVKAHGDAGSKWNALNEAANSKDTCATRLGSRSSSELSKQPTGSRPEPAQFSHPTRGPSGSQSYGKASAGAGRGRETREGSLAGSQRLSDQGEAKQRARGSPAGVEVPQRRLLETVKAMWLPLLALFVTFFVTFNVFPRIGPVGWHYRQKVRNHFVILFGIFSVADTIGRSMPSLEMVSRRWLRWALIPERPFCAFTFARALFFIPCFLSYKLQNRVVLNDFWWLSCLMAMFAFTHGWCTSLGFIYALDKVQEQEKGIAGPLAVVSLSLGILTGLYLSLAY